MRPRDVPLEKAQFLSSVIRIRNIMEYFHLDARQYVAWPGNN
jgi:hypothetical protein